MSVQAEVESKIDTHLTEPKFFNVILHNDNRTTFDFVIVVLTEIFQMSEFDAEAITMQIHENGQGVAGCYTHEIAEQKAEDTINFARANQFPLMATLQESS